MSNVAKLDWNGNAIVVLRSSPHQCRSSPSISSETPLQRLWCPYYLTAWQRLLLTFLPSIFMTGVHSPSPHPKSPVWQRMDVGFESKIIVIIWVVFVLDKEDNFWITTTVKPLLGGPWIKRTSRHFPMVSKIWRFHCLHIKNSIV